MNSARALSLLVPVVALALTACTAPGPRPVLLNEDQCGYCRMEVTDARFAAEAITVTGRIHVFDSVECLAGYAAGAESGTVASLWVTDAEHPGTFVKADAAAYLVDSSMRGPMGRAVAFASTDAARAAQGTLGGTLVSWRAIVADSSVAHAHGTP